MGSPWNTQFTDTTIHGLDNSWTRHCADMPIHGLWMIHRKMFCGQMGLVADKLLEVTALPVAFSGAEIIKS